jgi:hypothetical protein
LVRFLGGKKKKTRHPAISVILCESRESRNTSSKEKADPPSAVAGLEGIGKRVGSWGK